MSVHEPTELSDCHNAPVYTAEGAGVRVTEIRPGSTYYYACSECGQPCDTAQPPAAHRAGEAHNAVTAAGAPTFSGYYGAPCDCTIGHDHPAGELPTLPPAAGMVEAHRRTNFDDVKLTTLTLPAGEVEAILDDIFRQVGVNSDDEALKAEALQAIEALMDARFEAARGSQEVLTDDERKASGRGGEAWNKVVRNSLRSVQTQRWYDRGSK